MIILIGNRENRRDLIKAIKARIDRETEESSDPPRDDALALR